MAPAASLVLATRNRREELRALLVSAREQSVPLEIIVMDDGSSDGTPGMVQQQFPEVRFYQLASARGPAFQRNRGTELASSNIVISLDDDALFISPRTVAQTLEEFDHPRVGAVGIPFINVQQDRAVRQQAPSSGIHVTDAFVGAAHAVRRDVFLQVGGYREHFFYMGEEGDFCLRMMNAGYVTRLGSADPVHHLESFRRNLSTADFSGRRNDILFCWHNVPMPHFPLHLLGTTVNGLAFGLRAGRFWKMFEGMASGYMNSLSRWKERQPVSSEIYRLHRSLKKHGPRLLSEIEPRLPELKTDAVQHS